MALPSPTLTVENGTGVAGANAYTTDVFVSQYLADQGRGVGTAWDTLTSDQRIVAIVQATSYIENRYRQLFKGIKQYSNISVARSTLSFTAQPLDTEIVAIGAQSYRASTALVAAGDFLIGASLPLTILNLLAAVSKDAGLSGTGYHEDTALNPDAGLQLFEDDEVLAFGKTGGTADNTVATTTTVTGATWNFGTLNGGSNRTYAQPLSFPRAGLVDRDGFLITSIPLRLKQATAEYSERAAAALLAPDPDIDSFGGFVVSVREKVGPIDTSTEYLPGSTGGGSLPSYPAADRLIADFITSSGQVISG